MATTTAPKKFSLIGGFSDMPLKRKLPIVISIASLLAGGIVGALAVTETTNLSRQDKAGTLEEIVSSRSREMTRLFELMGKDLRVLAANPQVLNATENFIAAIGELGENGPSILQDLYINENPNIVGEKQKLFDAQDGSTYSDLHSRYHRYFKAFVENYGFYDVFLFDAEGNNVYTYFKELDFGENLRTGRWNTHLKEAYEAALKIPQGSEEVAFADFKPYAPSNNVPAAFMAYPLYGANGTLIGVAAIQLPIDQMNGIMNNSSGLGDTGEVMVVGSDHLMRSNLRLTKEDEILVMKNDTAQVKKALEGESGVMLDAVDMQGNSVVAAYMPLDIMGVRWAAVARLSYSEIMEPMYDLRNKIILEVLAIIVGVLLLGHFIARSIVRRVNTMSTALLDMAEDRNVHVPFQDARDEIGAIARSVNIINQKGQASLRIKIALDNMTGSVMIADTQDVVIYMNPAMLETMRKSQTEIAKAVPGFSPDGVIGGKVDRFQISPANQANFLATLNQPYKTTIRPGGKIFDLVATPIFNLEGNRLGTIVEWSDVTIERAIENEIEEIVDGAANGNFGKRLVLDGKDGFMLKLATGINKISDITHSSVDASLKQINLLADGDLTQTMEGDFRGVFAEMQGSINTTIQRLREIVGRIKNAAEQVSSASGEISAGSSDLAQRTQEQASSLEETAASMEELTGTVRQNSENAKNANNLAASARNVAENGGKVVSDAVGAMGNIERSSQKIAEIIGVIDEIAFQTNLLALNAAVEAARAGEAGKGFAVVASEVRSLAGRSASASKEIKALISESGVQVKTGSELVNQAGKTLGEIVTSVKMVADIIAEISTASQEQATGINEVSAAVTQMDEVTQQNAALVEENEAAASSLVEQARQLDEMMKFFTTDDSGVAAPAYTAPKAAASKPAAKSALKATVKPAAKAAAKPAPKAVAKADVDSDWEEF